MIFDYLKIAIKNLMHRQLRTWLTILGIVIGVASIIALVTATQGLENYVQEQAEAIGTNRIIITPPGAITDPGAIEGLTQDDVDVLAGIADFEYVAPYYFETARVEYDREIKVASVIGWPADLSEDLFTDYGISFEQGRTFTTDSSVALLGYRAAKDLFGSQIRLNNRIKINDEKFKVIGIVEEIGNPEDDNQIYIPLEVARSLFDAPDAVAIIDAKAKDGVDIDEAVGKAERALERIRDENSFSVTTATQLIEQFGNILTIINLVLVGIAGISLVVGAVGITNSMYASVLQRTREIGVMKAIGATTRDVVLLFLLEAALLGLVGGILGVAIGTGIAKSIELAAALAGFKIFQVRISPLLILFGLVFAMGTGMLAGTFPARSAAKLAPVEALRK